MFGILIRNFNHLVLRLSSQQKRNYEQARSQNQYHVCKDGGWFGWKTNQNDIMRPNPFKINMKRLKNNKGDI